MYIHVLSVAQALHMKTEKKAQEQDGFGNKIKYHFHIKHHFHITILLKYI